MFIILTLATVALVVRTSQTNQELASFSKKEFEIKLGIRAATQIRLQLYSINWTASALLGSSIKGQIPNEKKEVMFTAIEASFAQLDNGIPKEKNQRF